MNPYFHALLAINEEVRDVSVIGETLAYTWFGRPNYAYSEAAQKYWIGSTKDTPSGTTQHVTEYDIATDTYVTTEVGTAFEKDDHNQAQILIRQSDNRLIAFYTEHNGVALRWKISTNPLDGTSWGTEKTSNPYSQYSYLSPYQDSSGNIFIFFRTTPLTAKWYVMKSTDGGETFGAATLFFDNGAVQAYLISSQDGDKIHFTASNGHPKNNQTINVNPYHFYFDMVTETAHKSDSTSIAFPLDASKLTLIQQTTGNDSSWILDVTTKNGLPRVIYVFYPSGRAINFNTKELYYSEWNGSAWSTGVKIAETMVGHIEDDATINEPAYSGASRFDTANPDIIWMPKQVDGVLEIHQVDLSQNPVYIAQLTFGSLVDNWRPISVPSPVNNLLWIKKNIYNMYTNYNLSLQTKTVQV